VSAPKFDLEFFRSFDGPYRAMPFEHYEALDDFSQGRGFAELGGLMGYLLKNKCLPPADVARKALELEHFGNEDLIEVFALTLIAARQVPMDGSITVLAESARAAISARMDQLLAANPAFLHPNLRVPRSSTSGIRGEEGIPLLRRILETRTPFSDAALSGIARDPRARSAFACAAADVDDARRLVDAGITNGPCSARALTALLRAGLNVRAFDVSNGLALSRICADAAVDSQELLADVLALLAEVKNQQALQPLPPGRIERGVVWDVGYGQKLSENQRFDLESSSEAHPVLCFFHDATHKSAFVGSRRVAATTNFPDAPYRAVIDGLNDIMAQPCRLPLSALSSSNLLELAVMAPFGIGVNLQAFFERLAQSGADITSPGARGKNSPLHVIDWLLDQGDLAGGRMTSTQLDEVNTDPNHTGDVEFRLRPSTFQQLRGRLLAREMQHVVAGVAARDESGAATLPADKAPPRRRRMGV
jgi:hypothetical protein